MAGLKPNFRFLRQFWRNEAAAAGHELCGNSVTAPTLIPRPWSRWGSSMKNWDPAGFKPKKAVVLTKVSRYEFEKLQHENMSERQLEESLTKGNCCLNPNLIFHPLFFSYNSTSLHSPTLPSRMSCHLKKAKQFTLVPFPALQPSSNHSSFSQPSHIERMEGRSS